MRENIEIRLISAAETKFTIQSDFEDDEVNMTNIHINLLQRTNILDDKNLELNVVVSYIYNQTTILESGCQFVFAITDIDKYIMRGDNGRLESPQIMPYVLDVAIGAIRGILISKTSGTPFAKLVLPLVDTIQLLYTGKEKE